MSAFSEMIKPWRERYEALDTRERRMVQIMAALLLPFAIYFALVYPVQKQRAVLQEKVLNAETQLHYMQTSVQTIVSLRGAGIGEARNGRSLAQVVADSARNKNLVVARLQPKSDHELQVWLDDAEFDRVLPWLYELETASGVQIASANVTAGDDLGHVRITLKLKDGGA